MGRQYDAVILDLFGTLVERPSGIEAARVEMANILGVEPAGFETAWRQFRVQRDTGEFATVEAAIEAALGWLGAKADESKIEAAKAVRYQATREGLRPRVHAIDVLTALRTQGYLLGLVSNCSCEIPELWSETQFDTLFDVTVYSASEGIAKPDREMFVRATERLGVQPDRCLYIADGESDELDAAAGVGVGLTPWLLLVPHDDPPKSKAHAESVERWRHRHLTSVAEVLGLVE